MSLSKGEPMRWIHSTFGYLMSVVALLLLVACGDIPTSESRFNPSEEPVTISLRFGDENAQTGRFKGTFRDVTEVFLEISDNNTNGYISSLNLYPSGNIFTGEVNNLSVGSSYNFIAKARGYNNSTWVDLFDGSTYGFIISEGNNFLQLRMSPIEDSTEQIQIPRISRVYYNKNMLPGTEYPIQIEVEAAVNDNITYQLTVDNGTFQSGTSVQNQQILTKYTTFPVTYTTPNDNNTTVNFTLSVTNSQNYTVTSNFSATVSNKLELEPGIIFNPVVLSLEGERIPGTDFIRWTTKIDDEADIYNLTPQWRYVDDNGGEYLPVENTQSGNPPYILNITDGNDDVYENDNQFVDNSSVISLGGDNQTVGLRFQSLNISQGTSVSRAYLDLTPASSNDSKLIVEVFGEFVAYSQPFSSNLSSRNLRTSILNWDIYGWQKDNYTFLSSNEYPDSVIDITLIVNEIINQPDWVSGNPMSVLLKNTNQYSGVREFYSHEFDVEKSARLIIFSENNQVIPSDAYVNDFNEVTAYIPNYNPLVGGILELKLTSMAGDNVTVTWPVAVNQFPDTVTVNALSSGVSRIATGPAHSCVVVDNGTNLKVADNSSIPGGDNGSIYCWGVNAQYQLGNNASGSDNQTEPVLVDNVTFTGQLVSVTAADNFTCGLDNESEVKCWGSNLPPNLTGSGIDNRSLQMDAGGESLCAVLDNSSLACVGSDNLTTGIPAGSFKQVSVGDNLTHPAACAIAENNTVNCWGEGTNQIITGAQLDNATQVAVGTNHACAVRMDGLVKCWGDNTRGQLGNNTNGHYVQQYNGYNLGDLTDVVYVSVGARHTCAVRSNGTMRCWGDRANGKIGNNTDEDGVDSTASFLGGSFTNAVQMALGHEHTCVLLENPADPKLEVLCWGLGDGGRLGLGDNETRLMP